MAMGAVSEKKFLEYIGTEFHENDWILKDISEWLKSKDKNTTVQSGDMLVIMRRLEDEGVNIHIVKIDDEWEFYEDKK